MAPLSGMEYDWAEIRTISLACGLQNTQFAMSSVFSAFFLYTASLFEQLLKSTCYGFFALKMHIFLEENFSSTLSQHFFLVDPLFSSTFWALE